MADINPFTLTPQHAAPAGQYISLGAFLLTGDTLDDPLTVGPLTGTRYRVSTDGGLTFGPVEETAGTVSLGHVIEVYGLASPTPGATLYRTFTVGSTTAGTNLTTALTPANAGSAARQWRISGPNKGLPASGELYLDAAGQVSTLKHPSAILDYAMDFTHWMQPGDTLTSATLTPQGGLTATLTQTAPTAVVFTVSGGTLCTPSSVTVTITTQNGLRDSRTLHFILTER